jgi:hypothetical protein
VVKIEQTPSGLDEQNVEVLIRPHADLDGLWLSPSPPSLHNRSPYWPQLNWGGVTREAAMASNSSPNELREHGRIFRQWAVETDLPEMREAFFGIANSITIG